MVGIVQQAEETEQQFVARMREKYRQASSEANKLLGEAAAQWTERYCAGRTDADFANLFEVSRSHVGHCRKTWERFAKCATWHTLTWSHHRAAVKWQDADDVLQWADDTGASVAEMTAYRNIRNGKPATPEPPKAPTVQAPEPHAPIVTPNKTTEPKKTEEATGASWANPPAPEASGSQSPAVVPPVHAAGSAPAPVKQPRADPGQRLTEALKVVQETAQQPEVKPKAVQMLWKLLRKLDPTEASQKKPTVAAMVSAIPDDWEQQRRDAATDWAEFKQSLTGKAKVGSLKQWETALKVMARYPVAVLQEAIETAISNGWQGWEQESVKEKLAASGVSARVRTPAPEPEYRDFPGMKT